MSLVHDVIEFEGDRYHVIRVEHNVSGRGPMLTTMTMVRLLPTDHPNCRCINETDDQPRRSGMNLSTAVFLINKDLRAVKAVYEPEPEYKTNGPKVIMFKTLDKSIKKDDYVVVPTNTRHGMTVVKVTEVDVTVDFDDQTKVEWVIAKVDTDAYKIIKEQEEQAIEVLKAADFRKRREALAQDLTASANEIKQLQLYKNGDNK